MHFRKLLSHLAEPTAHKSGVDKAAADMFPGESSLCLPDIQGPLLISPQGARPRTHAVIHHLLTQVMDFCLKPSVL